MPMISSDMIRETIAKDHGGGQSGDCRVLSRRLHVQFLVRSALSHPIRRHQYVEGCGGAGGCGMGVIVMAEC